MSLNVLASMLLRCLTSSLPVLAFHEYLRGPPVGAALAVACLALHGPRLLSQQGPRHPQHRARGHHQVDGHLVPLQHYERDDRDHQREEVEAGQRDAVREQHLRGEVDRQVGDHTHYGRRDPDEDRSEPPVVGQKLYVRRQEEDEQEARQERRVGGDKSPERPVEEGREGTWVIPGADQAHVLGDHNQGARRGLGQPQPLHHLVCGEPPVVVDRHVRDVAKDRVGSSEGQEGRPREEQRLLEEHVLSAPPQVECPERESPEHDEGPAQPQVAQHRWPAVGGLPVEGRLLLFLRRAVPPSREGIPGEAGAAQDKPGYSGGQDDQREGDGEEIEGDEGEHREANQNAVVDGALADPQHRLYNDRYHHRLDPVEEARYSRYVGGGYGKVRQKPKHEDRWDHKERTCHYPPYRPV